MLAEPLIYTPLKYRYTRYWKPFRERYYSLGWRIYHYRGRKIIYHGGYIRGYRAEIGYCPQEDVGIAFLQNSPNSLASKAVPRFFDLYFDHREALTENDSMITTGNAPHLEAQEKLPEGYCGSISRTPICLYHHINGDQGSGQKGICGIQNLWQGS
jgi:hypothetical protein